MATSIDYVSDGGGSRGIARSSHFPPKKRLSSMKNQTNLRDGFVYLDEIDPSIIVDIRYSSEKNLKKQPIFGMRNSRAVLSLDAALALKSAQDDLRLRG